MSSVQVDNGDDPCVNTVADGVGVRSPSATDELHAQVRESTADGPLNLGGGAGGLSGSNDGEGVHEPTISAGPTLVNSRPRCAQCGDEVCCGSRVNCCTCGYPRTYRLSREQVDNLRRRIANHLCPGAWWEEVGHYDAQRAKYLTDAEAFVRIVVEVLG